MSQRDAIIEDMIWDLLQTIDYDTAKQYYPDTAEEPGFADENRAELRRLILHHLDRMKGMY